MTGRFVVTGSGRCGTTWMSRALTRVGVPCGHEEVYRPGDAVWPDHLRADASWVAACKIDQVREPVALLVRHPLPVVKSMVEIGFFTWDVGNPYHGPLRAAMPEVYAWPAPQDRALQMWISLNTAALTRAEMVLRLDEVTRDADVFGRLLSWAGADPERAADALIEEPCNRHEDSRRRTGVVFAPTWNSIDMELSCRAIDLAAMLGLDMGEGIDHGVRMSEQGQA